VIHGLVSLVEIALQTFFEHITDEEGMRFITNFEDVLAIHMSEAEDSGLQIIDGLTTCVSIG
jgi:hypothetical protein